MKSTTHKQFLTLGLVSIVSANILYADVNNTLETPPMPIELNATIDDNGSLELPPGIPNLDDKNNTYPDNNSTDSGDDEFISCGGKEYFNPVMRSCTDINPISLAELKSGVWLDVVVDKDQNPPASTTDISGCTTITDGINSGDLNITSMYKDENNATQIESSSYAYYDETSGMLSMSFYNPDDMMDGNYTSAGTTAGESEMVYISRETIGDQNYTFLLRKEYFDNKYEMFIDGLIQNSLQTCADVENQLVFENDYFNPNLDMPIQFSGNVILPDGIDPHSVDISARKENWNFISGSQLDAVNNNAFTLGFNQGETVALQVNINTPNQWYQFYYTPTGLEQADWNKPLDDYMFNIDQSESNVTIDLKQYFADQVNVNGLLTFDTTDNVSIEFMDMQNGNYFGRQELQNSGTFSTMLPNAKSGDKFVMRLNKYSKDGMNWESYFVSADINGSIKLVPDTNIEWANYTVDANGNLQKVDDAYDNTATDINSMWLPDFEKTGYITVPQSGNIDDINISLTDNALDAQFFIIDGNVTLPDGFDGTLSFEAIDKNSGESLSWNELDKSTKQFKIKLDNPSDVIVRVNYEENSGGAYNYREYYLKGDGSLVANRDIQYTPILKDMQGNDLYALDKTADECMIGNSFWYQKPGADYDSGICYNDYPSNWIPDSEQTGFVSLTEGNKKQSFNLNFAAMEANTYKLEGHIVLPDGFMPNYNGDWNQRKSIMIEAIDGDTGMSLGSTNISKDTNGTVNTYAYSLKLDGVDENSSIIVKLTKEDNTANDGKNWESFYLEFDETGAIVGIRPEDSVQWQETGAQDDYGYNYNVPDVDALDLTADKTVTLELDYETILGTYESTRLAIKGNITLTEPITLGQSYNSYYRNNVRVELINTNNGEWVGSREAQCADTTTNSCTELNFDIDIPSEGNYSLKVIKELDGGSEEYYYNFGTDHDVNGTDANTNDKLVNAQNIQFVEAAQFPSWGGEYKNWLPDPTKTGYITMTSGQKALNIDFTTFASSRLSFAGTVAFKYDFEIGEYCTNGTDTETIKECEWTKSENVGYNNWIGSKMSRVEVIDANTGEYVASTELRKRVPNTNLYEFKLDLGDADRTKNFIVRITKESSKDGNWKFDEIYYNFGSDNAIDGTNTAEDKLVNGKRVIYKNSDIPNGQGYYNWMPDSSQTGYIAMTSSIENFAADLSTFGDADLKISGQVTFKSDFDITSDKTSADISAIDATTGMLVGSTPIEDDGSYTLNLGEDSGKYILQVNYSYNDYNNWQNSWWKNKYYDFGNNNAYGGEDDELLNDMDVRWVPVLGDVLNNTNENSCWQNGNYWDYEAINGSQGCYAQPQYWVPNVNGIDLQNSVKDLNIDLSATVGNTLNISVSNLPSNATDAYVNIVDPKSYGGVWQNLNDGNVTITELKDGNYTVEFGYTVNGTVESKHFFIKDSDSDISNGVGAVAGNDVRWQEIDSTTNMWGPNPADTTYVDLSGNMDIVITIPTIVERKVDIALGDLSTNSNVDVEFRSIDKPYSRWEQLNSGSDTNVSTSFTDVKDGKYILSFSYDDNQYTCDGDTCQKLKKDVEWVAKDSNGNTVCGGDIGWDSCDYSQELNWMPDVTPLTVDGNESVSVSVPSLPTVTATIDLGADFANERVDFNIWQYNGSSWNWKQVDLNSTGGANVSMKVSVGNDYIIEIWANGLGGYTYTADKNLDATANDAGWIASYNTWSDDGSGMWAPRDAVLTEVTSSGLDLGTANIGSDYHKVTITVENLDTQDDAIVEDVWVSLEGTNNEGYYGEGNANWELYPVTYDENITLKVPNGTYNIMVFPMNHKGGYASDGDSTENESLSTFTKLGWNHNDNIVVSDSSLDITVSLPAANEVGTISGTVTCGKDDCSGWIDAWNMTGGKGTMVDVNGSYTIKGLEPGNYEVSYWSFDNTVSLNDNNVTVTENTTTTTNLEKTADSVYSISGSITGPNGVYAVLIKTDGTEIELVATRQLDDSGKFNFGEMAKPSSGYAYYVAGAILTLGQSEYTVAYADEKAVDSTVSVYLPSLEDKDYSGSDITVSLDN